jgi:CTP:molybdopterin cytidylyltransferase MocA
VEVAAVVREGEPDVAREATAAGAALVEVRDAEAGLSASLRAGVRAKSAGADALLVVLVDQWGLTPQDLTRLVKAWQQNGRAVVASAYSDVIGVPAIFGRGWFHVLEGLEGDRGARDFLRSGLPQITAVDVPNAAQDLDTMEDLVIASES